MAAWGYEFYLLVLKVSLTRERDFQHEKIKFVSPSGHVISSISYFYGIGERRNQPRSLSLSMRYLYVSTSYRYRLLLFLLLFVSRVFRACPSWPREKGNDCYACAQFPHQNPRKKFFSKNYDYYDS